MVSLAFQLTEMKARLDVSEMRVSELEQERHQQHPEEERWRVLGRERLLQEKKDTEVLSEALHEMKEENRLLKQKNASMTRRKEYYESEISRLNKALLDMLKKQHPPVVGTPPGKGDRSSIEEMRTQLEVLKQQDLSSPEILTFFYSFCEVIALLPAKRELDLSNGQGMSHSKQDFWEETVSRL
ncbi:TNFAIP3-interacting protein 3 [Lonchura striata]|uniref:TNFAIP3-interacting protein 3 n=1 Tax=Lonchura striata TaxID=40157 RepID=A0A218UYC6_9PASE|nr:TNFAIP3-interacting protein 3 [Lonchura striata domestica]